MEEFAFLADLVVVFLVSGCVVFFFQRLRLPSVAGLLLAGVLVGPYGLQLVGDVHRVELLAEVGVVVLLFTVGLEFSLSRLWRMTGSMLSIGLPQVLLTGGVTVLATAWYLESWGKAIFAGMLVAMSSTAVVLKLLTDRGEIAAPQGRISVAVLLLQDLLVLVFMITMPLLAQAETERPILIELAEGLGVVVGILLAARYLVPPILFQIMKTRSRELFLGAVVVLCLGTAWITASAGLSLALGAFLAGLAVSDSEYAQQALAEVLPFRDTLSSLFFVSIGMLLDLRFVGEHLPLVMITVVAILALKFVAIAVPTWLSGYPLRVAVLAGMALPQVGEFSFVLARRGIGEYELLAPDQYQTFLAAAVVTMTLTPLLIVVSRHLAERLPDVPGWTSSRARREPRPVPEQVAKLSDHVIVAGYGINGRNVTRVLRDVDIPYCIVELNPVTVRELRREGEPILFGDCSRPAVLEHLGIERARMLVLAISDPETTRRAVRVARNMHPELHILVRTRYVAEVEELRQLGASEIIPEEFETSVEIFARVLEHYQVPRNLVLDLVGRIRRDHYEVLRISHSPARIELPFETLADVKVESCLLRGNSPCVGRSLQELDVRRQSGATVIAIRRGDERLINPPPDTRLAEGDVLFVLGDSPQIGQAVALFDPSTEKRQ
jgi:CPA2 family monovalent cation:H+ antiporter-2